VDTGVTREPANVECILIADDLTGACDTGVQFVRRGLSCRVEIKASDCSVSSKSDVLAFNTDSRSDGAEECRRKIEQVAIECRRLRPSLIFKKVDSTLRGNLGEEIASVLHAFKCEAAIVAPALPEMGRRVRNGVLHWIDPSGSGQIDIPSLLAQQGICSERLARVSPAGFEPVNFAAEIDQHLIRGKQFVVVDCESQHDLDFMVRAGTALPRRVLWVGSAGLGASLADHMAKARSHQSVPAITDAPMLFVIGSTHPATSMQRKTLLSATDAVELDPVAEAIGAARQALRGRHHLVVNVANGEHTELSLRQFFAGLEGLRVAAMLLAGGDTGTLVCNAIGARSIDLRDEIVPGVPWGICSDGMFRGLPIVTKSGGFGDENALLRCAEFFVSLERPLIR